MLNRLLSLLKRAPAKPIKSPSTEVGPSPASSDQEARELRAQGNQCLARADLTAAEQCFRHALACSPNDTDTLTCLGYTLKELVSYAEARSLLSRATSILGDVEQAHEARYLLGQIAELEADLHSATSHYREVLRLKPEFSLACVDLRRLYLKLGKEDQVRTLLEQCVHACPQVADYCYWYGDFLLESKDYDKALQTFEKLIELQPESAEALNNRGICLVELNRCDEAIQSFSAALALNPDLAQAYSNRGAVFMRRNAFASAIADFKESVRLSPDSAIPHNNLGEAMRETRQLDAAIAQYDMAMQLEPKDPVAYWNKSLALLLKGEMLEGFSLYEYRFNETRQDNKRGFIQPLWLGETSLEGKTILLHCEQGLGDTIQFCRYAPLVAALGAQVILEVQKPLVGLMQDLPGVMRIVERGQPLPSFDCHCPLLSLPHAFRTDADNTPRQERYLSVDNVRREQWRKTLGVKTKPLVGIVWSGNANHKNDHNRSLALSTLMDNLPGCCRYISLQKEIRQTDQLALGNRASIEHFGEALTDFSDTAALCDLMDVVISVDTSVAHLAAALGRPTWVLLSYSVDWRWMLDRSDSPWYPSVRIYRQQDLGDWSGLLQNVARDLSQLASKDLSPCVQA